MGLVYDIEQDAEIPIVCKTWPSTREIDFHTP